MTRRRSLGDRLLTDTMRLVIPMPAKPLPRPRAKKGQHAYLPDDYQRWARDFGILLANQAALSRQLLPEPPYWVGFIFTPTQVVIEINHTDDQRGGQRGDLDNLCKSTADIMVARGLIADDRLIHALEARFTDKVLP